MTKGVPHEDLVCSVIRVSYRFPSRAGDLFLEADHCCSMSGAIRMFEKIDPDVEIISSFSGGRPDTIYVKQSGGWAAYDRRTC